MRGISPSPPNLGGLTGFFPGVLTKAASTERNFALSVSDEIRRIASNVVRNSSGVLTGSSRLRRERGCAARCGLSFLSAGNLPPCGVRGLCGAVVRCFGYDKIAIEFSYIDERKQSRRSLVPGFRHISSCTQSRPSERSCAPLCEPLTDRGETIPLCALRVFWALLRALRLCPDFGRTLAFLKHFLARAARLLGDLLPVLGVPLRVFGGSFRVLGDLLRLLGGFSLSISKHFSSSRLLDRSGCGHKEQENRARSATFSTVQRLFKAKSN